MYIDQVKIRSLRCFNAADITLRHPPGNSDLKAPNVNLLLGDNGAGKTTVLRAIALAALAPIMAKNSGYVSHNMVRRDKTEASVEAEVVLHNQDLDETVARATSEQRVRFGIGIHRRGDHEYLEDSTPSSRTKMYDDNSPAYLVVGYGATRRVADAVGFSPNEQGKSRVLRYQRVAGLFESDIALRPLVPWLPDLARQNKGRYAQVVDLIDRLLPEGASFLHARELGQYGEYLFRINGVAAPFSALSDGYRAYIGWIADLLYHVCMGAPPGEKLINNRGVVLVDEIDLHLHPEWQRVVVSTLAAALPNLQFVFSTHSPIVAGSLQGENIFVMEPSDSGATEVKQFTEPIYGLDAQQVLLSPYFGLTSTRAPEFVDEIEDLSRQLTPDRPDIALSIMRKLAGKEPAGVAPARKEADMTSVKIKRRKKKNKK